MTSVSDLGAHLGFWMRVVSNHVSTAFAAKVAGKGVTVAEWAVMRVLYEREPTAPSAVAEQMGMTRGAVTKLADRLIDKGFIARKASREDGRAQTLSLTAAGARLVPELAALADRNDAETFGALSAAERKTLERLLRRIVEHHQLTAMPVD